MTSTRKTLALGAIAVAAGVAATQPVWAQVGRRAAVPAPVPVVAPAPIVTLLSTGPSTFTTITPASSSSGPVGTRPPASQPIPGPIIYNN
jgi:hypothetical protein